MFEFPLRRTYELLGDQLQKALRQKKVAMKACPSSAPRLNVLTSLVCVHDWRIFGVAVCFTQDHRICRESQLAGYQTCLSVSYGFERLQFTSKNSTQVVSRSSWCGLQRT